MAPALFAIIRLRERGVTLAYTMQRHSATNATLSITLLNVKCLILSVIALSVIVLSVDMLSEY